MCLKSRFVQLLHKTVDSPHKGCKDAVVLSSYLEPKIFTMPGED